MKKSLWLVVIALSIAFGAIAFAQTVASGDANAQTQLKGKIESQDLKKVPPPSVTERPTMTATPSGFGFYNPMFSTPADVTAPGGSPSVTERPTMTVSPSTSGFGFYSPMFVPGAAAAPGGSPSVTERPTMNVSPFTAGVVGPSSASGGTVAAVGGGSQAPSNLHPGAKLHQDAVAATPGVSGTQTTGASASTGIAGPGVGSATGGSSGQVGAGSKNKIIWQKPSSGATEIGSSSSAGHPAVGGTGDVSGRTFDTRKHYTSVKGQQGNVSTDADARGRSRVSAKPTATTPSTFDNRKHYTSVKGQQGRVLIDADAGGHQRRAHRPSLYSR